MFLTQSQKTQSENPLRKRIAQDRATQLRLKYDPYYQSFDRQDGVHVWKDGQRYLMLSSNEYLGLSEHPEVVEAAQRALLDWGTSFTGSRMANGSRTCHLELEAELADFVGKEACHVSAAGYLSCASAVATFADRGDTVVLDRNVHSSLWSGLALSGAEVERAPHNDAAGLGACLDEIPRKSARIAVVEGVYSMEGHLAPLDAIAPVARDKDAFLIVDDAHGLGVFGDEGRGTPNHFKVTDQVDLICGSFSKALASTGGFIAGSRDAIEYLRTHAKLLVFSAAIAPAQAAAAWAALKVLRTDPEPLERLWSNTRRFHAALKALGVDTWGSQSPAVPIVIGSKERAWKVWKALLDRGLFTVMVTAPAVLPGRDLIRTAVSARHTEDQLDQAAETIGRVLG